jgi:Mn-containing catalase
VFFKYKGLQFEAKPTAPDAVYAAKLQELLGGAYGEMTVAMQYLFQGWNCRMPGKYKDLILDVGTEELAHVEMISIMIARLLEGAPAETTAKACGGNPILAAVVGGMNPAQAIVSGGGPLLADSSGQAWSGKYIIASGNLFADFHANATAEMQGIIQATRLYNMTDDPGVREMLQFNIARDTMHQNMWLAALEELKNDGLENIPVPSQHPFDERNVAHAYEFQNMSEHVDSALGQWASGPAPDGKGQFTWVQNVQPTTAEPAPPLSDPMLYATAPAAAKGPAVEPGKAPATGSLVEKVKEALS